MAERAAEIFERGRRSATSSREAWEHLEELSAHAEWTTRWLHADFEEDVERESQYDGE